MAVDYKPLNRNNTWTVAQKKAIKKVFQAAEAAGSGNDSSLISRKIVSNALRPYLDADQADDIQRLMIGLGPACDASNNSYDVVQHITGFRMSGAQKKIIRVMAAQVVTDIT